MAGAIYKPMCGLHGAHVVLSEHNENGKCRCINCNPRACQVCSRYKELIDESNRNNQLKLERCLACLRQK